MVHVHGMELLVKKWLAKALLSIMVVFGYQIGAIGREEVVMILQIVHQSKELLHTIAKPQIIIVLIQMELTVVRFQSHSHAQLLIIITPAAVVGHQMVLVFGMELIVL